jgi:hypothetical protein
MGVMVMAFNTTFNNISVILWRSVLLVEETEYPEKTTELSNDWVLVKVPWAQTHRAAQHVTRWKLEVPSRWGMSSSNTESMIMDH